MGFSSSEIKSIHVLWKVFCCNWKDSSLCCLIFVLDVFLYFAQFEFFKKLCRSNHYFESTQFCLIWKWLWKIVLKSYEEVKFIIYRKFSKVLELVLFCVWDSFFNIFIYELMPFGWFPFFLVLSLKHDGNDF